jgi:outer membrane protein
MGFTIRGAVVLLLVAGARTASAEPVEPAELPLAQVIAVAVRQSPELERARIDVEAARAQLLQAQGAGDTHVGAAATATASGTTEADPLGKTSSQTTGLQVFGRRALTTGGTAGVTLGGARLHVSQLGLGDDGKPALVTTDLYGTSLQLQLTQPLLRGAGAAAFEAPIHQAERQRDAAALSQEARARDLVVSLAQDYWEVAFAWRQLEVRKNSLDLAQQQLAYTETAIRAEKVARSEVLAVQQAIAVRKQAVIGSEQDLYDRALELRRLAGLEIGPDDLVVKTEALPARIDAGPLDQAAILRDAFAHSAELGALEATRRAAELAVAAADNAAKSRLDLDVSGTLNGADQSPGKAVSSAVTHPGYELDASLTYDHAIEHRTERGAQAVARATLRAAKLAERDARARLAVRATRAVQRARAALARIALGEEAIGLAEQNVVAEQKRFELGKSTNFEVLRRQDELEQARLRHAEAITDYLTARAELDGVGGTILARHGIIMP